LIQIKCDQSAPFTTWLDYRANANIALAMHESMNAFKKSRRVTMQIVLVIASSLGLFGPGGASAQDASVPSFKELDSIDARVQGCVTCHGQSGQGTADGYFPRIAGKPAGYLYNQLAAFRDGTRKYPPMNYLVAYLPDSYLHEIADHFAKQRPPFVTQPSTPVDAVTLQRGQSLVMGGDFHTGAPPCVACHGIRLTGMEPGIPGLVGLRSNYIAAQLTRWRVGDRHAVEPDCMKRVAARLSDGDIAAVAAWLAQQPPPKNVAPESSAIERMPYACGSQASSSGNAEARK
jgi:cytochrome c553